MSAATSPSRLDRLLAAVDPGEPLLILPHNDPDPDALASAVALRYLLAELTGAVVEIAYQGIIGRAENRALVRYLGRPLRRLVPSGLSPEVAIALVDTQPGAGNIALPPGREVVLVFDHHALRSETTRVPYADVRGDAGATSTVLTEYLLAARLELTPALATALFYGIKTDTRGLARGASPSDTAAYLHLLPRIDSEALAQIEQAQVSPLYFKTLAASLQAARVYGPAVISYVGEMAYPDMAAEMADVLLRLEGANWIVCMGWHGGQLVLAARTRRRQGGAGRLAQAVIGSEGTAGGHGSLAGGQVLLRDNDPDELAARLAQRALDHLHISTDIAAQQLV